MWVQPCATGGLASLNHRRRQVQETGTGGNDSVLMWAVNARFTFKWVFSTDCVLIRVANASSTNLPWGQLPSSKRKQDFLPISACQSTKACSCVFTVLTTSLRLQGNINIKWRSILRLFLLHARREQGYKLGCQDLLVALHHPPCQGSCQQPNVSP